MDISVIIVNYNVKEFLHHLLLSLQKASEGISSEIIVVDNASGDGSCEMLESQFPYVRLIKNEKNLGFSRANNVGLSAASGRYLLLLNPDTLVREDTLTGMLKFMDSNKEVGLAGCKILNPDGSLQLACRRGFPGPWTSFCKVMGLSAMFPKSRLFAKYNLTYLDENRTYEVDAISGSFMLIRREVYEAIGGLDEQFFMYGEDLDWCYRVQKSGSKVYYVHETQIIHYKGESTRRSSIDENRVFYDAMRLFVRKHFSTYFLIEFILRAAISMRQLISFAGKYRLVLLSLFLDVLTFNGGLFLAENLYQSMISFSWRGFASDKLYIVYTVPALLHLFTALLTGTYRYDRVLIIRSLLAALGSFFLVASTTYFFKDFAYSRAVLLMTYGFAAAGFILWRTIIKMVFGIGNAFPSSSKKKVLIVGTSASGQKIAERLSSKATQYFSVEGFISTSRKDIGNNIAGYKIVGCTETLNKSIREYGANEIIFSTPDISYAEIMELAATLQTEQVDFKIAGQNLDVLVGKNEVSLLDDISLVDLTYNISLLSHRVFKRLFDIVATFGILMVLPFAFMLSGTLRKSPFFRQMLRQLPAVLAGNMSLVGPRGSHKANPGLGKPGVTGYWFTEQEPDDKSSRLNIFYAKNQSFWLDAEILSKTMVQLLRKSLYGKDSSGF